MYDPMVRDDTMVIHTVYYHIWPGGLHIFTEPWTREHNPKCLRIFRATNIIPWPFITPYQPTATAVQRQMENSQIFPCRHFFLSQLQMILSWFPTISPPPPPPPVRQCQWRNEPKSLGGSGLRFPLQTWKNTGFK